jgi:RNA polymerase sigma factor (sigma-70 family)
VTLTTALVKTSLGPWLARACPNPAPDAALVRRFLRARDEAAFAALVDRHGPMVLGVACRVVRDRHTAEDVLQATFLLLARRAGQLRRPAALPAWLHRTAHHLALTALRARKRRDRAETRAPHPTAGSPLDELSSREMLTLLDEELHRLPEAFRLPLILCCLEGKSLDEAATVLGWTPGSVKGRLERGRRRLKDRLAARGLTFAAGAGVALLLERPAVAGLLRQATLRAARDGGSVSPAVAALADGFRQPVRLAPWKALLAAAVVGGAVAVGLASRPGAPDRPTAPPAAAADDKRPVPVPDPQGEPLPEGAVARLGSSRLQIGNSAFALTPDGRTIVAVSPEGIVRTLDAQTGRLLERRQLSDRSDVDPGGQATAQLSADGKTVVLHEHLGRGIFGRHQLTVRDVESGRVIFRHPPPGGKSHGGYGLAPDGKQLAVAEENGRRSLPKTLAVYDLGTGRRQELGGLDYNVYDIRFTTDGKRVLVSQTSSERDGGSTFACFDVRAGKELWRLPRKGQEFAVSPDGKVLISATFDGRFQVIETDPDSGKPTETFKPCTQFQAHPNVRAAIAPDNRTLAMTHFEQIILWDWQTGNEVRRFPRPANNGRGYGPELGAFSPDGRTMLTNLGYLQRWDLTTGKPMFDPPPADGLGGPIERLAFTAGGKELLASSWSLTSARWDVATGKQLSLARERFGHQWVATAAGLRALESGGHQSPHQVKLLDPVAGQSLYPVSWAERKEVGVNGLRAYTLTADGKTLLVAHGDEPGPAAAKSYVTACDAVTGRRLAHFAVPGSFYYPCSPFSPCGRWVVLGGTVYHVATGTELFAPAGDPGERLLPGDRWARAPVWFSADGRLLAGLLVREGAKEPAATDTLAVWELASGKVLARVPRAGFVAQAAFAPDGRTLALADGRGVRTVDLLTGKELAAYSPPDVTCDVTDRGCGTQTLAFAPDGRTLATGHRDGAVLLWKVPQPAEDAQRAAAAERDDLWADLGSDSPARARAAVERLARRPADATALLAERFRPGPAPADPVIAALVRDLDSDAFTTREEATRKLRDSGVKAEPVLRRALAGTPSLEMRRRVEALLDSLAPPVLRVPVSGETLRGVRAVEVLERVHTPEARQLLQAWADQVPDQLLVVEARAALERLGPAPRSGPAPAK